MTTLNIMYVADDAQAIAEQAHPGLERHIGALEGLDDAGGGGGREIQIAVGALASPRS